MFYQTKKTKKDEKGFTMVESLVAITILLIAVVGPLSLLATALRDSVYLRNEITANYLAQEGLEVVTFFNATESSLSTGLFCVDGTKEGVDESLIQENDPADCVVKLSPSNYYGNEGENTIFQRYVIIEEISNDMVGNEEGQELKITSTVAWQNSGLLPDRDITYTTYLYAE